MMETMMLTRWLLPHVLLLQLVLQCPVMTESFSSLKMISTFSSTSSNSRQLELGASFANDENDALFTQVISDVDDTLKSSGGVNIGGVALGGIDTQYERGILYPGVAQFMWELSCGATTSSSDIESSPPKVAIVTARAEEFKVALELKDTSAIAVAFQEVGEKTLVSTSSNDSNTTSWGLGPVLYGSVAEWIVQDNKGLRKFSNFEALIEQDSTRNILQYIYVGDTGEKDQEAGETMLREYPHLVKAVFLHVVSDQPNPTVPPPKLVEGRPVLFFRTYIGAAAQAMQLGFISRAGYERVVAAAEARFPTPESRKSDKWIDLIKDQQRVEAESSN